MDISVVIVNYNVKYFLEQCLHSVISASKNLNAEIIVVDNNSVDGSIAHIKNIFSDIQIIENKKNVGFSTANNQGIKIAKGKYVLLLNPDTVVQENTFDKCFEFMESYPDAGALGVKMIDGKGTFLPESKRALPTPLVAFFKIFGLSSLFPKSKTFGKYHLSYLPQNETNEIEILPGAFMFMRKDVLDKTGGLDESFFMYGEDIDLSYRIIKEGYKNYYFPETTIIHYKGESTKKGSVNYVLVFYKAMIIFARKHFSARNRALFTTFINIAIYFRAFIALIKRIVGSFLLPTLDIAAFYTGLSIIGGYWENFRFNSNDYYPREFEILVIPAYILLWVSGIYLAGGYEKPVKPVKSFKGLLLSSLFILIIYALLPENMRFSRALILLGALWTIISSTLLRLIFFIIKNPLIRVEFSETKKRVIIIGKQQEAHRAADILKKTGINIDIVGEVTPEKNESEDKSYLGNVTQLSEIIKIHKINELIFCAADMSSKEIMQNMLALSNPEIDFKIAPPQSLSIIGSNSINTAGDLYTVNLNSIGKELNRNKKRFFDLTFAIFCALTLPVTILLMQNRFAFVKNIFRVLWGSRTWVGYNQAAINSIKQLPKIKSGILHTTDGINEIEPEMETVEKLNIIYAQNYKISTDLSIILRAFKNLDKI